MSLGEETGWRGYALPRLQQRHSPLVATVVLAAIWVLWHAPLFLLVDTYRSFTLAMLAAWIFGLCCGAVVLSWLYNRSGGSILLVAVWHATYNVVSGTDAATGLLAATTTTLVAALAIALVVLEVRAARRGQASVLGPVTSPAPSLFHRSAGSRGQAAEAMSPTTGGIRPPQAPGPRT
jgi:membrane protease YdiL (CAAX protease family)